MAEWPNFDCTSNELAPGPEGDSCSSTTAQPTLLVSQPSTVTRHNIYYQYNLVPGIARSSRLVKGSRSRRETLSDRHQTRM
ncbi:hypothetical protein ElyMa_006996300 [Elysia marginata]|uniref:Uncharacterized protein n=1 Tax=Elysia marginata TaxID=1093978 RepID=A0AAV4JR59_9GAST|nr:hypothetical protein ElyMa_006996300 [Elysia marginata]